MKFILQRFLDSVEQTKTMKNMFARNIVSKNIWNQLRTFSMQNSKLVIISVTLLSSYLIFAFGKAVGEFMYYCIH